MKTAIYALQFLAVIFILCGFAALNAFVDKSIAWDVFAARIGLFTALTSICTVLLRRFER